MRENSIGERGSVFFFILLGIALFVALGFAVTSMTRSSSGQMTNGSSNETMLLALTDIRSVVVSHRSAIQMMSANGITAKQLNGNVPVYYPMDSACIESRCKIYNASGGGLSWYDFVKFYPNLADKVNTGGPYWTYYAYKGTTQKDLVYLVHVTKGFCNFINKQLGVTTDIDSLPIVTVGFFSMQSTQPSTATTGHAFALTTGQAPYLANQSEGCIRRAGPTYSYVAFLYAN